MTTFAPIPDTEPRDNYTASSGQTAFTYTFYIDAEGDIDVYVNEVLQTITTDYTVSGVRDLSGGTITFTSGLTAADKVVLVRGTAASRATGFTEGGEFRATALNRELAKLIALSQDQKLLISRALLAPPQLDVASGGFSLPLPVDGKTLVWDGTAGAIRNSVVNVDDIESAVTDAETAQTAAEAAQTAAEAAQTAAETALDNFDDRYLGAKASDPTLDNDGDALITGALYFNTTDDVLKVYNGAAWLNAVISSASNTEWTGNQAMAGKFSLKQDGELTISSGAITPTGSHHLVDTEGDASIDDLDTINGGIDGQILYLQTALSSRDVNIKSGTGNIITPDGVDITIASANKPIILIYDAADSVWLVANRTPRASQTQAEAGSDNERVMTPLRTKQSIAANLSGWEQYDSATLSAATSADFLMDITEYEYEFILSNITVDTDQTNIQGLLSTDGGSTFITTSTYDFNFVESDTSLVQGDGATSNIAFTAGAASALGNDTDEYFRAKVYIPKGSASLFTQVWSESHYVTTAGNDIWYKNFTQATGAKNANAIRFIPQSGATFTGEIIAFRRKV